MKIQIDGTNSLNKGAELMLVAILEQIDRNYPDASIFYNSMGSGYKDVKSKLNLFGSLRLRLTLYPSLILAKLGLPYSYFTIYYPEKDIDVLLDASGFRFGDQWNRSIRYVNLFEAYLRKMKQNNTKIILLPQALGPFKTKNAAKIAKILDKYVDLVVARESISYQYLIEAGVSSNKIMISTDFTNIVKGNVPSDLEVDGKVCIIPNRKMITHSGISDNSYVNCLKTVIECILDKGYTPYLLNHEGKGDLQICKQINSLFNDKLLIVSGLNAKEVKGVIGRSYFVFSSRFHGVASSLSQSVPCYATSWSHKYELLFKDYDLENQIVELDSSIDEIYKKISFLLNKENNEAMRQHLRLKQNKLKNDTNLMWEKVWRTSQP